ncbi:unnamed protein product [Arctogadus glacialis]
MILTYKPRDSTSGFTSTDKKPGYQSTTPGGTEPSLTTNPLKLESTEEVKNFTLTTGESRGGSRTTWAAEPTDHLGIESWARPS